MAKLVNLTPHPVRIYDGDSIAVEIPPSGLIARVSTKPVPAGALQSDDAVVDLVRMEYGEVENLPPEQRGVYYIVSLIVFQACPERKDLVVPDTSPDSVVRDEDGHIIGVRRLIVR